MKFISSPATEKFLEQYAVSQTHALLLTGNVGVGLLTFARELASTNGQLLTIIKPESKTSGSLPSISVERIRQLYIETRSRMEGTCFVIIDDADSMNHVAQNALLKLLEEPNESIRFILTSHAPDKLLTTIRSRSQMFNVPPLSDLQSHRLLKSLGVKDETMLRQLMFMASGLPAELSRLAHNESNFRLLSDRVLKAKQFVVGTPYQRLALVQSLGEDRATVLQLIETIILLLRRTITTAPDRSTLQLIAELLGASDAIRSNGNVKLHLSAAVVY